MGVGSPAENAIARAPVCLHRLQQQSQESESQSHHMLPNQPGTRRDRPKVSPKICGGAGGSKREESRRPDGSLGLPSLLDLGLPYKVLHRRTGAGGGGHGARRPRGDRDTPGEPRGTPGDTLTGQPDRARRPCLLWGCLLGTTPRLTGANDNQSSRR